jgi:hypothetical protein
MEEISEKERKKEQMKEENTKRELPVVTPVRGTLSAVRAAVMSMHLIHY